MSKTRKKVVVIGGGHGQAEICRGLKQLDDIDITAIVTVADDGGSTGRLRRQFHIPAMGDIRNVMIALAESETMLSRLMDYRFQDPKGNEEDIAGHNLGNLILTALTEQSGSFLEAVKAVGSILNVKGRIIPASTEVITLFAQMDDGVIVRGEANIPSRANRIRKVFYDREVKATPEAEKAILEADLIIYGIGSLYTSILPNVIIPGIREALRHTSAYRVYFCNAMTQPGETDGYCLEDHVQALIDHGAEVDGAVWADNEVPENILARYKAQNDSVRVVPRGSDHDYDLIRGDMLVFEAGLVRHEGKRIKDTVKEILARL